MAFFYLGIAVFERLAPRRLVRRYQRLANPWYRPMAGVVPGWAVVETTGRKTGLPRQVPVGGRLQGDTYWLIAGDGRASAFVKNLEADPRVRVRVHGRWRPGTAHVVDDDDVRQRLLRMSPANSLFLLVANPLSRMLTVRIDLAR